MDSVEGLVRTSLVYVPVPSEAGPFLVPFCEYDDWSLRDRYNEAIRIMNTLGASAIICETYGEVAVRRKVWAKVLGKGGELTQQRIENRRIRLPPRWRGQRTSRPEATTLAGRTWILRRRH